MMSLKVLCSSAVLFGLLAGGQAQTYNTASNLNSGSQPLDAQAVFTAATGVLTIDVYNYITASQVVSVAQNVTYLMFSFNGSGIGADSIASSSAYCVNIDSSGKPTHALTVGSNPLGWDLSGSAGSYLLSGLGGGQPKNTLVGGTPGDLTDYYTHAKGSIAGNGPHNPFSQGHAEWKINIAGLTAGTQIGAMTFGFNTTAGAGKVPGVPPSAVPEPFTIGLGIAGVVFSLRRKLKAVSH